MADQAADNVLNPTPAQVASAVANEPSHTERVQALIGTYEHGMNSNAPRTMAEFAELKALLLVG